MSEGITNRLRLRMAVLLSCRRKSGGAWPRFPAKGARFSARVHALADFRVGSKNSTSIFEEQEARTEIALETAFRENSSTICNALALFQGERGSRRRVLRDSYQ